MSPSQVKHEKRVVFVRHGESEGNIARLYQPAHSPLSSQGKEQAAQVAARLKDERWDALVSSKMDRAWETAQIIGSAIGLPPEPLVDLHEQLRPTCVVGKEIADPEASKIVRLIEERFDDPTHRFADEENFSDLCGRARRALEHLENLPVTSVLAVSHGYFIRTMLTVIHSPQPSADTLRRFVHSMSIENCGVIRCGFDGVRWKIYFT